MLAPLLLIIIAAFFYAATNHIDKYLISKAVKRSGYRALIVASTIVAGGVMTLIYLFICDFNLSFDITSILILFANSALYTIANIFWFKALKRDDTTIVAIMFQFIPVFMLLLSPIILPNQDITPIQLVGCALMTAAALFIAYEPSKKRFNKKRLVTLGLMTITSLAYSIWYIVQRYVNQNHDFNQTVLWSNITMTVVGIIILVFLKKYRASFVKMLKTSGKRVLGLNLVNELLNSFGLVFTTLAGTMLSVALVSFASQSVQPFIVILLGFLITKLFPKIEKEQIGKREVLKRIIAITVCVIGLAYIEFG